MHSAATGEVIGFDGRILQVRGKGSHLLRHSPNAGIGIDAECSRPTNQLVSHACNTSTLVVPA